MAGGRAARVEWSATRGTRRRLCGSVLGKGGGGGGHGGVLEDAGAQRSEALVESGFDLGEGSGGVVEAPLLHGRKNLLGQRPPTVVEGVAIHHRLLEEGVHSDCCLWIQHPPSVALARHRAKS
jgi:hypothetical protein